jgi:magnesium chelatase subunit I
VLRGKLEFESGEEGREAEHLTHLLRRAVAETARERFAGLDLRPLVDAIVDGNLVATGERVPGSEVLSALPELPVLHEVATRTGVRSTDPPGRIAAAIELALESLYLARKLAKDSDDGMTVYGP